VIGRVLRLACGGAKQPIRNAADYDARFPVPPPKYRRGGRTLADGPNGINGHAGPGASLTGPPSHEAPTAPPFREWPGTISAAVPAIVLNEAEREKVRPRQPSEADWRRGCELRDVPA
jgi:hypothetical protein